VQLSFAQDTIPLNTFHSFEATVQPDYKYSWWYVDAANNTTYFTSNLNKTEEYYWDTEGKYELFAQATDGNNCLSEIITKDFVVIKLDNLGDIAGRDTTIGSCKPYTLGSIIPDEEKYTFFWEPSENLDDPTSSTPVFIPGNSTVFKLTVTNSLGVAEVDSVIITVAAIEADAGDDILIDKNSSIILNGLESYGEDISYSWTTISGKIESEENTANPVVSEFGIYYLEITDVFGCVARDSVKVEFIDNPVNPTTGILDPPVAENDYETTSIRTEIKVSVLNNDTDPDNDIDPFSLNIQRLPFNGTAYVDYNDFTIHYIPNNTFTGSDDFEYQICDTSQKCSNAIVYIEVLHNDFLIPDAFSPNSDDINDYFEIMGIEKYEGNSLIILNRWGNKVYEAVNYGISTTPQFWDGKSNTGFLMSDKDLPTGTYFYVLKLGNGEKPIAGSIYLDR